MMISKLELEVMFLNRSTELRDIDGVDGQIDTQSIFRSEDGLHYGLVYDLDDGWKGVELSLAALPHEVISADVRIRRDQLLSSSDWTQAADAPVDKVAWATYRDALRNIPQQAGFPTDIAWPTKPE